MEEIKALLRYAFQTENQLTFPVSAPGSAAMETCFVNLVEPGDKVIIAANGVFSQRMLENVERCGGSAIIVEDPWGRAIDPDKVEAAMKEHSDAKIFAFVHAETSTGALSDGKKLCSLAQQNNMLTIVDTVTSLAGSELKVDEWGMDAVYSGSQKCLSCVPGIGPVTFSERAIKKIESRKTKVQSWFLDLNLVMGYWKGDGKRSYHHTAPVNAMYALHESLLILHQEGIEKSWARHLQNHQELRSRLDNLGLEFIVPQGENLPQLNAVQIPVGIDEAKVRQDLLEDYNLEIGAGLGPLAGKIWRIGLMGYASSKQNVLFCSSALGEVLKRQER
jgi:alanine-glyoxylate transaminase/serine-glyoxylate transaminase/serine-pyruvate transaminase